MKSIIAEASSIAKAIEKAWSDAGSPGEFSIKIFEHPRHNFLGMAIEQAKVGIFFAEQLERPTQRGRRESGGRRGDRRDQRTDRGGRAEPRTARTERPERKEQTSSAPQRTREPRPAEQWNDETVSYVTQWLNTTLGSLEAGNPGFDIQVSDSTLKIIFNKPLASGESEQHLIFSSFVHLLMETLRARFKRRFANLRIHVGVKGSAPAES